MSDLKRVVEQLKKERDQAAKTLHQLDAALSALSGNSVGQARRGQSRLSAAARAKIAAAQRARWAKLRADHRQKENESHKKNVASTAKKKTTMSAAARKRIAAAQRARWARVKSAQKKSA
jgi:hypothetical protein